MAPGESPDATPYPPGQIGAINLAVLANTWGGTVYNSFIFATSETPTATAAPIQKFPPPQPGGGGFHLLNAGYALQWWAFACFAVYVWVRMVRDEYALTRATQLALRRSGENEHVHDHDDAVASPFAETKDQQ